MMLGLRMLWSQSIRLTCFVWIFHAVPSRTTRCPAQPVSTLVSSPQNSLIRKFDRTMRVSSCAVAKTSTLVTRRTVREAGAGARCRRHPVDAFGRVHGEPVVIAELIEQPRLALDEAAEFVAHHYVGKGACIVLPVRKVSD